MLYRLSYARIFFGGSTFVSVAQPGQDLVSFPFFTFVRYCVLHFGHFRLSTSVAIDLPLLVR